MATSKVAFSDAYGEPVPCVKPGRCPCLHPCVRVLLEIGPPDSKEADPAFADSYRWLLHNK